VNFICPLFLQIKSKIGLLVPLEGRSAVPEITQQVCHTESETAFGAPCTIIQTMSDVSLLHYGPQLQIREKLPLSIDSNHEFFENLPREIVIT
jgi:hypothetical protein